MFADTGPEYFARRAEEERRKSEMAISPSEYRAHLILAYEYERFLFAKPALRPPVARAEGFGTPAS